MLFLELAELIINNKYLDKPSQNTFLKWLLTCRIYLSYNSQNNKINIYLKLYLLYSKKIRSHNNDNKCKNDVM